MLLNIIGFVSISQRPELKDHPLSLVRDGMFDVVAAQSPRHYGRAWTLNAYSFCVISSYKSSLCDLCLLNTNLCTVLYVHLFKLL